MENLLSELPQENSEITTHYKMRLSVYQRAKAEGTDPTRAALLATIFKNCYFIGTGYNEDLMRES
jgi:hypothetical protein